MIAPNHNGTEEVQHLRKRRAYHEPDDLDTTISMSVLGIMTLGAWTVAFVLAALCVISK